MTFAGPVRRPAAARPARQLSVSFLVDDLEIRRGGVAGNICFGLGQLGPAPAARRCGRRRLRGVPGLARPARRRHLRRPVVRGPPHRPVRLYDGLGAEPDRVVLPRRDERGPGDRPRHARRPRSGAGRRRTTPTRCSGTASSAVSRRSRSPLTPRSSWRPRRRGDPRRCSTVRRCCSATATRLRCWRARPAGAPTEVLERVGHPGDDPRRGRRRRSSGPASRRCGSASSRRTRWSSRPGR